MSHLYIKTYLDTRLQLLYVISYEIRVKIKNSSVLSGQNALLIASRL